METKTNFKKWDIVIINMMNDKKRPAVVISPERHNLTHDAIVLFITSNTDTNQELGNYTIEKWQEANLPKPAMIKMNFSTVNKKRLKKIGALAEVDKENFEKNFTNFFNIS